MKKINKLLFALVLGICTFSFMSLTHAADFSLTQVSVECDPNSIEAGEQANCYIIGQPSGNSDGSGSLHGFVAQAFTTKDLRLEGASIKDGMSGVKSAFTKPSSVNSSEGTATLELAGGNVEFRCNVNIAEGQSDASDFGCAVYYSTTDNDAFTKASITSNLSDSVKSVLPSSGGVYGTIGTIKVKLDEASQATGSCGQVCVKVWNIENKQQYANYLTCLEGDKEECGGDNVSGLEGGKLYCTELHMKVIPELEPNPDTGAFISYAILIAGALIAISAVAMAKKNNKFNKI